MLVAMLWGLSAGLYAQSKEDCRLNLAELQPVIGRYNPFFGDHQWNARSRIEMARMDPTRLLIITQDGCKRHHIRFTLLLDPSIVKDDPEFWLEEVSAMLYKVYFEQVEYAQFGKEFEASFLEKVQAYGLNRAFNFPLGTRNFICELLYDSTKGARINVEMITFLFKEDVTTRRQGIPSEQDDGWTKKGQK